MIDRIEDVEWRGDVVDQLKRAILITRAAPETRSLASDHIHLVLEHLASARRRLGDRESD